MPYRSKNQRARLGHRTREALVLWGALWLTLHLGCKKEDRDPPSLQVTQPIATVVATATDRIRIEGTATDWVGLGRISATLTRENGQIETAESQALTGTEDAFSFLFTLGNRYSPTGNYTLDLQVSDAAGNTDHRTIPVALTELPLQHLATALVVQSTQGSWSLMAYDTQWVSLGPPILLPDSASALLADSREANFAVGLTPSGRFLGYDGFDLSPRFSHQVGPAQNLQAITALHQEGQTYYLGSQIQPYVRRYGVTGNALGAMTDISQPVQALATTGNWLIAAVGIPTSQTHKVDAYDIQSGILRQFQVLTHPTQYLLANDTHIWAIGPENGTTQLHRYSATLAPQAHITLNAALQAAAASPTQIGIATQQGLYSLPWSGTTLQLLSANPTTALAYNQATGQWFQGGPAQLRLLNANGNLLTDHSTLINGTVKHIAILYNK